MIKNNQSFCFFERLILLLHIANLENINLVREALLNRFISLTDGKTSLNVNRIIELVYNQLVELDITLKLSNLAETIADNEGNVIFGGRLAEYKYYDMHHIVAQVLNRPEFR